MLYLAEKHGSMEAAETVARRIYAQAYNQRIREDAIAHYGGACACCGETHPAFLAIDHIDGGGNQHRKTERIANMALWLKRTGYPEGFRVLCHNCNQGRQINGGTCPHQGAA